MAKTGADFTNTFRHLSKLTFHPADPAETEQTVQSILEDCPGPSNMARELLKRSQHCKSRYPIHILRQLLELAEHTPEALQAFGNPEAVLAELREEEAKMRNVEMLR